MRRSIQLFLTFSILVACLTAEVRTEDDHERTRVRVVPESMGDKAARMTRKAGDTVKGFTEEAAKTVHRFAGSTDDGQYSSDDKYGNNRGHREEELVDKIRERGRVRTRPETMSETAERVARQAGETAKGFTNEAAKTVHRFAGSGTETEQEYETTHKHAHPTSWHKGHLRGGDADTTSESDERVGSGETEWETETDREGRPTGRYRSRAPGWETETETGARPYDLMLLEKSKKTKEKGETTSDRDTSGRKKVGEFDNRSGAGRYPIYEGDWESGTHDERTVGEKISDTAKGAVETVKKAGQRAAEVTKNAFGNATETVKSVGNKTVETVKGAGEKTAETAKTAGGKVKEGVKGTAETGKEAVVGAEQAAEKKAAKSKAKFQKTGEDKRTREAAEEAAETAREKDTAALEKARKKAAAAAERTKETAKETGEATKEKAKEAAEKVKETAAGAKEKTKKAADKAAETAKESKDKVRDTYLTGTKAPHHTATPTEAYMPAGTDTGPYLGMSEHAERMRAAQPEVSRTETTTHTRVSPTETIAERLGTLAVTPTETVSIGTLAARDHRETAGRPTVTKTTTVTHEKTSRIDAETRDELQHALDCLEKSVAAGDASPDDVRKAYRKAAEKIRNVLRERGDELRERMKHGKIDDRSVDLEMRRESRMKRTIDLLAVAAGDTMGGDMDEEARGDTGDLAKVTLQDCIKDLEREQSGDSETETENLLTIDPKSSHSKASKSEALAEDSTVTTEKRSSGLGGTATETVTETVTTEHGMGAIEGSMGGKLHTRIGQTVLWTVFGIMAFSAFYFVTAAGAYESHKRVFHYITGAICGIAALSYLCMALGIGMFRFADGREFYYARYWDWMFTTPLLLVDLGLLAGTAGSEIFFVVAADALMIASGLVGSYQPGSAKWYLFAFGVLALLPVIYSLVTSFRTKALLYSPEVGELFNQLTMLTLVTWAAYPLVWVLAEGTRWISVDVEIVLYGILDVAAKALFGFILLSHRHVIEKASAQEHLLGG